MAPGDPPAAGNDFPSRGSTPTWQLYATVAAVALIIRGLYLWQIFHAPFFGLRVGDGHTYHQWATQIADGNWLGADIFYQAPLYPYVLGLIYRTLGDSALTVLSIQSLMGSGSCVLLAFAARSLFSNRAGLLAGLTLALYPPAFFLGALIQKTALATLLITALLALVSGLIQRPRPRLWIASGAVLGLLVLTRENTLIFAAVLLLWLLAGHWRRNWRRQWKCVGGFLLGLSVVLFPVAVRNGIVGGGFHVTTYQFGTNFFIGNNRTADGTYAPLRFDRGDARYERKDATKLAETALGKALSPSQVSAYWFDQSWQFICEQPTDWLRLMGRKLALTFNAAEIPDTEDQIVYAEWSWLLRGLGVVGHFGVLLPATVFGLIMTAESWRRLWVLYLLGASYAATVVVFYIFARYRFPLVPILILISAGGIGPTTRLFRTKKRGLFILALAATLVAVLGSNTSIGHDSGPRRALAYTNLANALVQDHRGLDAALLFYKRALKLKPDFPKTHNDYGVLLLRLGRPVDALEHLEKAIAYQPDYIAAHHNLGIALERLGRHEAAADQYRKTLLLDPKRADAHNALGHLAAEDEQFENAIIHYRKALEHDPEHIVALNNLGVALARTDRIVEAEGYFARAVEIQPDYADAVANLIRARRSIEKEP